MSREICCVSGLYFEYNDETNQPSSPILPKTEFEQWYAERYMNSPQSRRQNYKDFTIRLARVAKKGTSSTRHQTLQELVKGNAHQSFSAFCTAIISAAQAPAEAETKFQKLPKAFKIELDDLLRYWATKYRESAGVPKDRDRAACFLNAYQNVRLSLFGEHLEEARVTP